MARAQEIVIVGAGQAGFQAARSLRSLGFDGAIRIVGEEPVHVYQRPPLSKSFLSGEVLASDLMLASSDVYSAEEIDYLHDRALSIDSHDKKVSLSSNMALRYDHLILATGAQSRKLPGHEDTNGLVVLRTLSDAENLRDRLRDCGDIAVIGGGFLGLEVASVCAGLGVSVRLLETQSRLMSRSVSKTVSDAFYENVRRQGVCVELGVRRLDIRKASGSVVGIETENGFKRVELVLASVGAVPNTDLALSAGLHIDGGIVVNESLVTANPAIQAIGDCATYPNPFFGRRIRLESIQNAVDQAQYSAGYLLGLETKYRKVPWFWSDQAGLKLQIAGDVVNPLIDCRKIYGSYEERKLSVFSFLQGTLVGVESVNLPKHHMLARKILSSSEMVAPDQIESLLHSSSPLTNEYNTAPAS
jgi:3-phenylpropionate/trans-cinnamate dioxygenase ferredoxin reductase subunit